MAAAALLALTTSAFSQATKQNTVVLNTLQPHSVRTSLRNFHEETAEQPKLQSAAHAQDKTQANPQSNTQDNPRGICLAATSSAAAPIAACDTYIGA